MIIGGIIYLIIGFALGLLGQFIMYCKDANWERNNEENFAKIIRLCLITLFYPIVYFIIILGKLYEKYDDWCYKMALKLKGKGE